MAEKKNWVCFYCKAEFDSLSELQEHRPVHDTTDAESDISDRSRETDINDVYYSSQESDYEAAKNREVSEEEGTDVDTVSDLVLDNDDRDKDFVMEEIESEEEVVKKKKSTLKLSSKKKRDVKGKGNKKEGYGNAKVKRKEETERKEEVSKRKKKFTKSRKERHRNGKGKMNAADVKKDKSLEMEARESQEEVGNSSKTMFNSIGRSRSMSDVRKREMFEKVRSLKFSIEENEVVNDYLVILSSVKS